MNRKLSAALEWAPGYGLAQRYINERKGIQTPLSQERYGLEKIWLFYQTVPIGVVLSIGMRGITTPLITRGLEKIANIF